MLHCNVNILELVDTWVASSSGLDGMKDLEGHFITITLCLTLLSSEHG